MTDREKLVLWQDRIAKASNEYAPVLGDIERRSAYYNGTKEIASVCAGGGRARKKATNVRNIVYELIESQVDSSVPMPQVTAVHPEDEHLAKTIEDMLRQELRRLPFEELNDLDERTTPVQGGDIFQVEWDNRAGLHCAVGALCVSLRHPRQVIPQPGIDNLDDADYVFLRVPQTKDAIERRYGITVEDEEESNPDARAAQGLADELVTQNIAYYRNAQGGIGLFSWVNDTVLEDMEDYQARRLRSCKKCGALADPADQTCTACGANKFIVRTEDTEPAPAGVFVYNEATGRREPLDAAENEDLALLADMVSAFTAPGEMEVPPDANAPDTMEEEADAISPLQGDALAEDLTAQPIGEWLKSPIEDGAPGAESEAGAMLLAQPEPQAQAHKPVEVPYYKPNVYPLVVRKNISSFGSFLGDSDVDQIDTQQEAVKKLGTKIEEKLLKGGSYVTLPQGVGIETTDAELKIIRLESPAQKSLIDVLSVQPDISKDAQMLEANYQWAKSTLGISDSFQGKRDSTATSGIAKQVAVQQSAGRLESKRVMKNAAYARLYEIMFKFWLAYADEPRPLMSRNEQGEAEYKMFDRYDFLKKDAAGQLYWADEFIFDVDQTATLAANRQAMWQEIRANFQLGAFGSPASAQTQLTYWQLMERNGYPGAGEVQRRIEQAAQAESEAQQQAAMMAMQQQTADAQALQPAQSGQGLAALMGM